MKYCCKGLFLFLLLSVIGFRVRSQEEVYTKYSDDFYPKSPKAEGLSKYIDFPVNNSSGVVNVSIPLHSLQVNGFDLPVSLDYHTGGIEVSRMASNVGLCWSLNAGGLITRNVKGSSPDEGGNSYGVPLQNNWGYLTNNADVVGFKQILLAHSVLCGYPGSGGEPGEQFGYFWDMEPDMFQFTAPGISGSFTHDYQGNPLLIPEQDLLLENVSTTGMFEEWVITKPDGTKYFFGTKEKSKVEITNSVGTPFSGSSETSAWLLDKIITSKNDTIQFKYSENYYRIGDVTYGSESILFSNGLVEDGSIGTKVYKTQNIRQLEEIETKNELIEFEYGVNDREDLDGSAKPLEYISILDKRTDEVIRKFQLVTSYFQSSESNPLYSDVPDYSFKRLRLDNVKMYGGENLKIGQYDLSYNKHNNAYNNAFPPRLSRAVDHWGYYNGHDDNTRLLPNSVNYRVTGADLVAGADRSADGIYKKAFILDEVQYPTGGVAEFYYTSDMAEYAELNTSTLEYEVDMRPAGGLLIKKIVYDPGDGVPIVTDYEYSSGEFLFGGPEHQVVGFCDVAYFDVDRPIPCGWTPTGGVYSSPVNQQWAGVPNQVLHRYVSVAKSGNGRVDYRYNLVFEDFPKYAVKPSLNVGQVSSIEYFNENDQLVKRVDNEYKSYYRKIVDENDFHAGRFETPGCMRLFTPYSIYTGFSFLSNKTEEVYSNSGVITTSTDYIYSHLDYEYDDDDQPHLIINDPTLPVHHQLTSNITEGSNGETIRTDIKYVADYSPSARTQEMGEMVDLGLITFPVEINTSVTKSGSAYVTNAQYLNYKNFDGYFGIGEIYNFKSDAPVTSTSFSVGNYSGGDFFSSSQMYKSYEYKYNWLGNLIEQRKVNDSPVCFLYHPGYAQPAHVLVNASAENVAYTSFEYPVTVSSSLSTEGGWTFPNQRVDSQNKTGLWSLLNGTVSTTGHDQSKSYKVSFWAKKSGSSSATVQVGSNTINITSSTWNFYQVSLTSIPSTLNVVVTSAYIDELMLYPDEAHLSSYAFTPKGITTQVDPNGKTTYYEYDSYGRLKLIKDHNEDILKGYHYKYISGN